MAESHSDDTLLRSLRQQYDNDSALLEHMDREHSKLRAEHEELEADYNVTSKNLGKALVDLAVSEAKVQDLRAELAQLRRIGGVTLDRINAARGIVPMTVEEARQVVAAVLDLRPDRVEGDSRPNPQDGAR